MYRSGKLLFWESVVLSVLFSAALGAALQLSGRGHWWYCLPLCAVLVLTNLLLCFRPFGGRARGDEMEEQISKNLTLKFLAMIYMPVAVCDKDGKVVWSNGAAKKLFADPNDVRDRFLDQLTSVNLETVLRDDGEQGALATIAAEDAAPGRENAVFRIRAYPLGSGKYSYYITFWNDKTDFAAARREMLDRSIAVAYIMIDNLDELEQYVKDDYRYVAAQVDKIIKDFAQRAGGVLKEYEKDRYLMLFEKRWLDEMTADRFSVLDQVRQIHAGESNIPVTLSMGVAHFDGSLPEKEAMAKAALDTALQRGGDQAVYRDGKEIYYFGGRTKTMQKRTKVRSRVVAGELAELLQAASNVIVMGHANADHDSIASCVAAARLAMHYGKKVHICIRPVNSNVEICVRALGQSEVYQQLFVEPSRAVDLVRADTLLIINDVNNERTFEAPELYENIKTVAVIDHHRKTAEFRYPPRVAYIDPSASSASELWAEILEQLLPVGALPEKEAELLLAGILLDTNDFTRNSGVRTFAVAQYLRTEGGNTANAKQLFRLSMEDYLRQANYQTNVSLYRGNIALTVRRGEGENMQDRIAAAKAADQLLEISDVNAAFALLQIDHTVYISARSDGTVNVQLILESLGGGGHYDVAGAQLSDTGTEAAVAMLKAGIDAYFDQDR